MYFMFLVTGERVVTAAGFTLNSGGEQLTTEEGLTIISFILGQAISSLGSIVASHTASSSFLWSRDPFHPIFLLAHRILCYQNISY